MRPIGFRIARAAALLAALAWPAGASGAEQTAHLSGGGATNLERLDAAAFSQPSATLPPDAQAAFLVGNGWFKRPWVAAPGVPAASDGLGPLFNARSCRRCHINGGRGHPPDGPGDGAVSMVLRLSVPPATEAERRLVAAHRVAAIPEPTYGLQLQDRAISGHRPEGRLRLTFADVAVPLAGEAPAILRRPSYAIDDPGYGPLAPDTMLSARVAPPMVGLGLLEAVSEADILAAADPDDADGDGISGRANRAWSRAQGRVLLGRFGWKAAEASLPDLAAAALAADAGVSSPLAPDPAGGCTARQPACRDGPHGADGHEAGLEASAETVELLTFYSRHLAVPARRGADAPAVRAGERRFRALGCAACHRPELATRADWPDAALAGQTIRPYTDLLLHDMGDGLADNRPEGAASGREWRTAPLWGLGLTETVNGHTFFLHDGRARNLTEAILWHGGEAAPARVAFQALTPAARTELLAFLESL